MADILPKKKGILLSKYPNFPGCFSYALDENETHEGIKNNININVDLSSASLEQTLKTVSDLISTKNVVSEDDDWEKNISKIGWMPKHVKLFNEAVKILDSDRLARLTIAENKRNQILQTNAIIDRSADRLRKAFSSIACWDIALISWLQNLLMENLPPSYLASFIDILQTLKHKMPSLIDKILFWKPGCINNDLVGLILKKRWQPTLNYKYRKLNDNALIIVIPPLPQISPQPQRIQRLFSLLTTMCPILPINLSSAGSLSTQSLQTYVDQIISLTRSKILELKNENPDRKLLLVGMHSSSSLALQVALVEQVFGVVCFGFSYNDVHGYRGFTDDHILNIKCPILMLIGQNSDRSSDEEIEILREKLITNPKIQVVTVGGADNVLRVCAKKRKLEGVTQEMVDHLIVDEIAEFASKTINFKTPPVVDIKNELKSRQIDSSTSQIRKRKNSLDDMDISKAKKISKTKPMKPDLVNQKDSTERKMIVNLMGQKRELQSDSTSEIAKKVRANQTLTVAKKGLISQSGMDLVGRKSNMVQVSSHNIDHSSAAPETKAKLLPIFHQQQQQQLLQRTNFSPPKFTILRTQTQQQQQPTQTFSIQSKDTSASNIFDMPIVMADSDGKIITTSKSSTIPRHARTEVTSDSIFKFTTTHNTLSSTSTLQQSTAKPFPTVTITKNKNILIQKPPLNNNNNKLLVLNGLTGIIGRSITSSNIVVPSTQITTARKMVDSTTVSHEDMRNKPKKIEIIDNTIIKHASVPQPSSNAKSVSFINLSDAKSISKKIAINHPQLKTGQLILKTANLKSYTLSKGQHIIDSIRKPPINIPAKPSNLQMNKK